MNKTLTISSVAASIVGLLATLSGSSMAQQWSHSGPLPRAGHSAVLDPSTNKMIVFGGVSPLLSGSAEDLNDVWWLNNTGGLALVWVKAPIGGSRPAARNGQSAVYDPGSNRMIVFGGGLGLSSPCANDVWALANANGVGGTPVWVELGTAGGPPAPRHVHTAVYDQTTNTMIVYGGNNCFSSNYGDVWTLTNANGVGGTPTWAQLSPTGAAPGANEDASAVYDSANNRMIVYGGSAGNNVWVLTNANGTGGTPVWLQLSPSGSVPPARSSHSAVYDAANNIMTIFGGQGTAGLLNDVWILSSANGLGSPAWTQLNPSLTAGPQPRWAHTAVYNPTTDKMTIFGGVENQTGSVDVQDVWVISHANGL